MTIKTKHFYAVSISETGRGWMVYRKNGEGYMRIDRRQRAYVLRYLRWLDQQKEGD